MRATCQQFQEILDEPWKADHADAEECGRCEDQIARIQALWNADRPFFASAVPSANNREETRRIASVLRTAERTMTEALVRATQLVKAGYTVKDADALLACLAEVRYQIVLPLARMIAARDPDGRTPEQIAQFLLRRVRFLDGRPVITEDVAAELPCPFEPEESLA
jgi:hypothetical protein